MYRQFNIQQFYVQPTQRIHVFCVDLRTNSDYFPIQHKLTGFYNRGDAAAPSVHYTTSCKHCLVLLRMGKIIARNMLS